MTSASHSLLLDEDTRCVLSDSGLLIPPLSLYAPHSVDHHISGGLCCTFFFFLRIVSFVQCNYTPDTNGFGYGIHIEHITF